jgi:hypothetical protein
MDSEFVKLKIPTGIKAMRYLREKESESVLRLFEELMQLMDETNGLIAKQKDLGALCGISVITIVRATNRLKHLGFISTKNMGHASLYKINPQIATRGSKMSEYSAGYELWDCKLLINTKE